MEMRTAGTIVKPLLNLTLLMGLFSASACSLILPFDDENGPIVLDAAPDSSLTEQICSKYEDNDSLNEAHPIEAGSFTAALCPAGDRDHYAFDVAENQDLTIQVTFENGNTPAGDLDLVNGGYHTWDSGEQLKYSKKNLMKRWMLDGSGADGWYVSLEGNF